MRKTVLYGRVLTLMVIKDMSVRALARRVGMNDETLRRKLRGESDVTLREAHAIRKALSSGLRLDELFREAIDE